MRALAALVLALCLGGCVYGTEYIDVPYKGRANLTVVEGAEKVCVEMKSRDRRTVYRNRVGVKKNNSGMEVGPIEASNDVARTFSDAVGQELESLGFCRGPGGKKVTVELMRFYNDFKIGFLHGASVADALVEVSVRGEQGGLLYVRGYEGGFVEEPILFGTPSVARETLIKAMSDTVSKAVQDKGLHKALLRSPTTLDVIPETVRPVPEDDPDELRKPDEDDDDDGLPRYRKKRRGSGDNWPQRPRPAF